MPPTKYSTDMPNASVDGIPYNFENVKIDGNNFNLIAYQTFDTLMSLRPSSG
jgi:hypothetical protein